MLRLNAGGGDRSPRMTLNVLVYDIIPHDLFSSVHLSQSRKQTARDTCSIASVPRGAFFCFGEEGRGRRRHFFSLPKTAISRVLISMSPVLFELTSPPLMMPMRMYFPLAPPIENAVKTVGLF